MKKLLILSTLIALAGCNPFEQSPIEGFQPKLMVATSNYPTTDVAFIGSTEDKKNVVVERRIATTDPSDISIANYGDSYYRLGRYTFDNITKINLDEKNSVVSLGWQYSVRGSDTSANPKSISFLNEKQAYISRPDAGQLWVVNPSATNEVDFLITTIDLSTFSAPGVSVPRMESMVIVGNKLFVVLARLTGYDANENSAVAVIDTATNKVIDTDLSKPGVQAIELPGVNATELSYLNNKVYIAAAGNPYGRGTAAKYSGGIYSVDTNNYEVKTILDDGTDENAPYGNIIDVEISPYGDIYFIGRAGWGNDAVFAIDAGSSTVRKLDLGEGNYNIGDIESDLFNVYVGVQAQIAAPFSPAGVKAINLNNEALQTHIETSLNPHQIIVLQ